MTASQLLNTLPNPYKSIAIKNIRFPEGLITSTGISDAIESAVFGFYTHDEIYQAVWILSSYEEINNFIK